MISGGSMKNSNIKIIAFENCKEIGEKVDEHIKTITNSNKTNIINSRMLVIVSNTII